MSIDVATSQLRLLGPVELIGPDGGAVALGGAKQRAVLAWLALCAPQSSTVDQIATALWGQEPPETARNAVQVYISSLRKALRPLGADILRRGAGYLFDGGGLNIDASEFEKRVAAGRIALRADDPERAARLLSSAVELWRGSPFSGLESAPFAEVSRTQLEAAQHAARVDLVDSLLGSGRPDEAATAAEALLSDHPFEERVWAILITAHYQAGRQSAALESCRRVRRVLADELGLDPGPDLVELEKAVLDQSLVVTVRRRLDADAGGPVAESGAHRLPAMPSPMVGRDELVAQLIAQLSAGQRLISLTGMGGIGKTSIAIAVAHGLRAAGVAVVFSELETAHDPVIAIERICRDVGIEAGDEPILALGRGLGTATCSVLVLDNIEQIEFFGPVLNEVLDDNPDVAILTTTRRPLRSRHEHTINVPPLSVRTASGAPGPAIDLFVAHVQRVRPSLDMARSIEPIAAMCALLDGMPLAIALTAGRTRMLTPQQLLDRTERETSSLLDLPGPSGGPSRQQSLRAVLDASMSVLSRDSRTLIEVAAALDGWTPLELLEGMTGALISGDFLDALEDAGAGGLIQLHEDGRCRLNVPVRDHARQSGDRPRIDLLIVRSVAERIHQVAPRLHGPTTDAAMAELTAWQDATVSALAIAIQCDHQRAAAMVLDLNRYWLLSLRLTEARRWSESVVGLTDIDPVSRSQVRLVVGTFASYVSHSDTVPLLTSALVEAEQHGVPPDRLLVNAWCCLGAALALRQDYEEAGRCAAKATVAAAGTGEPILISLARDFTGYLAGQVGDHATGFEVALAGITDVRQSGDRYDLGLLLVEGAEHLVFLGRPDDAWSMLEEAFELAARFDMAGVFARALLTRSLVLVAQQRSSAVVGHLVELLALTRDRYPNSETTGDALRLLACVPSMAGDHALAARIWGAADAVQQDLGVQSPRSRMPKVVDDHRIITETALGPAGFELAAALGGADPFRLIDAIIERGSA